MKLTDAQKLAYYKNKELAKQLILQDAAEDGHVVYGATASNVQLNPALRKPTEDVDVMVKNSKKEAIEMEKKLDKKYGGDFFRVEKAIFPLTYKVKSNVTNKTVVDYTKKRRFPKTKNILGVKYANLPSIKRTIRKTLRDEKQKFRWEKDKETLQRIKLQEKQLDW